MNNRNMFTPLRKRFFSLAAGIVCVFAAQTVSANTYVPNTFLDPVITSINNSTGAINGGATISLRSALRAAKNLGGSHTITPGTGTYLLQLTSGRQTVIGDTTQNITINGTGKSLDLTNGTFAETNLSTTTVTVQPKQNRLDNSLTRAPFSILLRSFVKKNALSLHAFEETRICRRF